MVFLVIISLPGIYKEILNFNVRAQICIPWYGHGQEQLWKPVWSLFTFLAHA